MSDYKRVGFPSLMTYLVLHDADRALTFMQNVFDAEIVECHRVDDRIAHSAVRLGGTIIEIGDSRDRSTIPAALHIYVPDVDQTYAKALANGGTSLSEVADMPYGERSGGVEDPCGNTWYIATAQG